MSKFRIFNIVLTMGNCSIVLEYVLWKNINKLKVHKYLKSNIMIRNITNHKPLTISMMRLKYFKR